MKAKVIQSKETLSILNGCGLVSFKEKVIVAGGALFLRKYPCEMGNRRVFSVS